MIGLKRQKKLGLVQHQAYSYQLHSHVLLCLIIMGVTLIPNFLHADTIFTFVDKTGVVHFTNCPSGRADGLRPAFLPDSKNAPSKKKDPRINKSSSIQFDAAIKKASRAYGIDPGLIKALIQAESAWDIHAVSPKGALGLMQLMPGTAIEMKVKNPLDPEDNILGGVRYLNLLLDRFDGDLILALAAYNAGLKTVKQYGDIPPFKETQGYIRKVLGMWAENSKLYHRDGLAGF